MRARQAAARWTRVHLVVLLLALVALHRGWRTFWFLTDDAHIQFRYVSNSLLGHGYVWNPPPFLPVEGYTSFLWVLLLDGIWRLTGYSPPEAANAVSLCFSSLTVVLTAWLVLRMPLRPELAPWRTAFLVLVLAGLLGNRTFLAWSSSGLETAMFDFWILLWLYAALRLSTTRSAAHLLLLCGAVAMIALTRPDGLLYGASTLVAAAFWALARRRAGELAPRHALALLPLAVVPVHLLWRRSYYGEWLPNTYFAKTTGAWPEAGWRYALCFALEYALWVWLSLAAWVAWRLVAGRESGRRASAILVLALATVAAHTGYYTVLIGGDHFEYRVYAHLVPLVFLSFLWLLNRTGFGRAASAGALASFVLLSLPVPWIHWARSRDAVPSEGRVQASAPVADALPGPARWYGELFDRTQVWLHERSICKRHHSHRAFWQYQQELYPSRAEGLELAGDGVPPVFPRMAVGVPAWNLPHVAILDSKGLNDYVIARTPVLDRQKRHMAHERHAPGAYVADFAPNVIPTPAGLEIRARAPELTERDVRERELEWRRRARAWRAAGPRETPGRNLVLLELDHPGPASPELDELAAESFVFTRAESSSPEPGRLRDDAVTLAERLAGSDYATGAFVGCGEWPAGRALERGFAAASLEGDAAAAAAAWLAERRERPFLLFCHPRDARVAPVLDALDRLDLAASTLVFAVSRRAPDPRGTGELDPRLALFEELAATWIVRAPPSFFPSIWCRGPRTSPARSIDVLPTALEALGIGIEDLGLQGRSLFPEMSCELPRRERVFRLHPELGLFAVRRGNIALYLSAEDGRTWLYDLGTRPARRIDGEQPHLATRMEAALRKRMGAR